LRTIRYATRPRTDRKAKAAPIPTPAFVPLDSPLGAIEEVDVASEIAVVTLGTMADVSVVDEAAGRSVLVDGSTVLVAGQPSRETEKIVCKAAGDGAMNCSLVGSSQAGLLFESTPQRCQSPEVLFHVTSGRNCDVHLFGKPGQRPELVVQPAT
jgi:hypothetical protein